MQNAMSRKDILDDTKNIIKRFEEELNEMEMAYGVFVELELNNNEIRLIGSHIPRYHRVLTILGVHILEPKSWE